jgi:hypothetical protein
VFADPVPDPGAGAFLTLVPLHLFVIFNYFFGLLYFNICPDTVT